MDSYKLNAGPSSSNHPRSPGEEASKSLYSTPRLASPALPSRRHSSSSPLAASSERDHLPYPILGSNTTHLHKTQRPSSSRSPPMLPPQRFSPAESPAVSRQPSQRKSRTRSATVTSDDGRSVFMSEFRKHSGTGARPDMKALYPDQTANDHAIASDEDSPMPGSMPAMAGAMAAAIPASIPRSDPVSAEPMERQSSSKRSSKIFARGKNPSDVSIAGDDSESGFRAKVSKLLKNKDSGPDLIADILAAEEGNAHVYEEHMKQKQAQGVSQQIDFKSQTAILQYNGDYYPTSSPLMQVPPAGTPADASAMYDAMIEQQELMLEYASDLESAEPPKRPRRKSKRGSRSSSPPLPESNLHTIESMMSTSDAIDAHPVAPSKHYRTKSKSSKKSPAMSPAMLPTIPQSKTVPYPSHLIRNASPPIDILELAALDKPSSSSRRKSKRSSSSKKSQVDYGQLFRHLYESTPSLDVIMQVILQPVETARKSQYPNLAILIALVELLIFIWLLYQAIIILEFACAVIRFICYPAIYILKAIASPFASMERV